MDAAWTDVFNRALNVGDRVTYSRKADGGNVYVVGHVVGPGKHPGELVLKLTINSVNLIEKLVAWKYTTGERQRPVSDRVTLPMGSLIRLDEGQDVT